VGKYQKGMNPTKTPDDWMSDLFRKRQQGRRMTESGPPPYVTGDGVITVDRRTPGDRRRPPGIRRAGQSTG